MVYTQYHQQSTEVDWTCELICVSQYDVFAILQRTNILKEVCFFVCENCRPLYNCTNCAFDGIVLCT